MQLIFDPTVTLHDVQKAYTLLAMDHFDGNKTQAANALGITLKTLYNWLHDYGVEGFLGRGSWIKGQADPSLVWKKPDLVWDDKGLRSTDLPANKLPGVL